MSNPFEERVKKVEGGELQNQLKELRKSEGQAEPFWFFLLTNEKVAHKGDDVHKQSPLLIGAKMVGLKGEFFQDADYEKHGGTCQFQIIGKQETFVFYSTKPVKSLVTRLLAKKVKGHVSGIDVLVTAKPDLVEDEQIKAAQKALESAAASAAAPASATAPAGWTAARPATPGTQAAAPGAQPTIGANASRLEAARKSQLELFERQEGNARATIQARDNADFTLGRARENLEDVQARRDSHIARYRQQHPGDAMGLFTDPAMMQLDDELRRCKTAAANATAEAGRLREQENKQLEELVQQGQRLDKILEGRAKLHWTADEANLHKDELHGAVQAHAVADKFAAEARVADESLQPLRAKELAERKIKDMQRRIKKLTADRGELQQAANKVSHWGRQAFKDRREAERADLLELEQELTRALEELKRAEQLLHLAEDLLKNKPPIMDAKSAEDKKYQAQAQQARAVTLACRHELQATGVAHLAAERQRTEAENSYARALGDKGGNTFAAEESLKEFLTSVSDKREAVAHYYQLGTAVGGPDAVLQGAEARHARTQQECQEAQALVANLTEQLQQLPANARERQQLEEDLQTQREIAEAKQQALTVEGQEILRLKACQAKLNQHNIGQLLQARDGATATLERELARVDHLKAQRTGHPKYQQWLPLKTRDPASLSKDERKLWEEFQTLDKQIELAQADATKAQEVLRLRHSAVTAVCDQEAAAEKSDLELALKMAGEARERLETARQAEERLVTEDDSLRQLREAYDDAKLFEERTGAGKVAAQAALDKAEKDQALAGFYGQISEMKARHHDILAKVIGLSDEHFEAGFGYGKGPDIQAFVAGLPGSRDENLKAINKALFDIVEQDHILQDHGASFEERKRALDGIPVALWPGEFREELTAYRTVQEAIVKDKERARIKKVARANFKKELAARVGVSWDLAEPLIDVLFDAIAITDEALYALGGQGLGTLSESDTKQASNFGLLAVIAETINAFVKEPADTAREGVEGALKAGETRSAGDYAEVFLKYAAGTMKVGVSAAKTGVEAARWGMEAYDAASPAVGVLGMVAPGLDIVLDGINFSLATYEAGRSIKLAVTEGIVARRMKKGDDASLALAGGLMARDSRNQAIKHSLIAGGQGVKVLGSTVRTVGTVVGAAGYGAGAVAGFAAGEAVHLAGTGMVYGTKFYFQLVDWHAAARAQETVAHAAAGSQRAMVEVFKYHQKYASLYILIQARDGDRDCLAMCVGRGLDRGEVLDSRQSLQALGKWDPLESTCRHASLSIL